MDKHFITYRIMAVLTMVFILAACRTIQATPGSVTVNQNAQQETLTTKSFYAAQPNAAQNTEPTPYELSYNQVQTAAKAGDPDAEYALGYMYFYGKNTQKNIAEGIRWIRLSASAGQPQAIKALVMIENDKAYKAYAGNSTMNDQSRYAQPARENFASAAPQSASRVQTAASTAPVASQNRLLASNTTAKENSADALAPVVATTTTNNKQASFQKNNIIAKNDRVMKAGDRMLLSTQHLRAAPSDYYTLQLMGSYNKSDVIALIDSNRLEGKATYYQTLHDGKPWYVLVYGLYKTSQEAHIAIKQLPKDLQQQKPWVNLISNVQASIREKMPNA